MDTQLIAMMLNLVLTLNLTYLVISLFGYKYYSMHQTLGTLKRWVFKFVFAALASVSLYHVFVLPIYTTIEIYSLGGFALLFTLLSIYKRKLFVRIHKL